MPFIGLKNIIFVLTNSCKCMFSQTSYTTDQRNDQRAQQDYCIREILGRVSKVLQILSPHMPTSWQPENKENDKINSNWYYI